MKILLIEDDRTVCSSLKLLLTKRGHEVEAIHQPNIALDTIATFKPIFIILDMNFTIDTSGKQGLRLLTMIRESHPDISIILMTGWATVQLAVQGMKLGAKDFMTKPWDNKDLLNSIESIYQLHHKNDDHSTGEQSSNSFDNIIGASKSLKTVLSMVKKVAPTQANILITGESGTGKELIAEAVHQFSTRKKEAFVKVNLGGIPNSLFESEMFGHKKGAFTGADVDRDGRFTIANNGTIFLDEVGELALNSQVKLLRVLQEKTYEQLGSNKTLRADVRVISATNKNLIDLCNKKEFREDLFYRLNLVNIHLPPLKDRRDDIPALTKYFIQNVSTIYASDSPYLNKNCLEWLANQEYKGNIRQLKNIVERTFLLNLSKKELNKDDFLKAMDLNETVISSSNSLNLQNLEIETIKKALAKHDHSISSSAKALGITRSSLYRRLEKYGIPHEPKI